jgi:hypothetical protein
VKKEIDPKVVYGIVGVIVFLIVFAFIRATGETTVPESAIKSPPPPGGFPGKMPPSAGGQAAVPAPTD